MRPFHPPRPNPNQPHRGRPGGDPGSPHLPGAPMHPAFPPPVPNLAAAANPMAAAAAANPFLALQLLGQAQQLQNLGFLAAAALQQQQQAPFFPGGFTPNPNQFAPYAGGPPPTGFNGSGAFRPGGAGVCGPPPPRSMMSPAGKGYHNNNNNTCSGGAPKPIPVLNVGKEYNNTTCGDPPRSILKDLRKDWNGSGGVSGEQVDRFEYKAHGISNFASENGNKPTDQKARFNSGRDGRDGRQFGAPRGRGRGRHHNQGRGRGNNWGDTKSNFTSHESPVSGRRGDVPAPASGGLRKRPPIIYDANEVKQWVEARKRNYPTSVNINKKLSESQSSDNQNKDKDAQLRRQELKEVLAKQQELGFELPELPAGYLSETEDQCDEKKNNWKIQRRDSRFGNRANTNKRPRYERGGFQSKRSKVWNRTPSNDGAMAKSREPTLLQKLLSSDIKKDRHRLLHTFKFMALNNFFKDWPDKLLQFPIVKVNQIEIENNIGTEDLDELENAERAKDGSINSDVNDYCADQDDKEDSASADSNDEDGVEDEYDEQFNEPEDGATA